MKPRSWINGVEQDHIAITDRGLHYGDGLFETMAAFEGQCPRFEAHYQRLVTGCERLAIPLPDKQLVLQEVQTAAAGQAKAVIKILLTSGAGGRGYGRAAELQPNRIVMQHVWPDYPEHYWHEGVRVKLCQTRLGCNPALAGIKHLNRLEQVLARNEWHHSDYAEGLMCDVQGNVIEGTMTNIFIVRDRILYTPSVAICGVAGVMRGWVMTRANELELKMRETTLSIDDIQQADEVILTNSLIGLWPVRTFESRNFQPGPIYQTLLKYLLKTYPVTHA